MITGVEGAITGFLLNTIGKPLFEKVVGQENTSLLDKRFAKAVEIVSKRLQETYPDVLGGDIDNFFSNSTVLEQLTKLLFRNTEVDINSFKNYFDLSTLPKTFLDEFVFELKNELLKYHEFERIFSDNEVYRLVFEMNNKLNTVVDNLGSGQEDFQFDTFIEQYKKVSLRNLSKINYFGLGLSPNVRRGDKTIYDIYVNPNFAVKSNLYRKEETETTVIEREIFPFEDAFDLTEGKHIAILGKPGAGKSLLGKYLMCSIFNQDSSRIPSSIIKNIPFRIELRKYFPYKKKYNANIIDYLLHVLKTEYYISYIAKTNIIDIFDSQAFLFIFDGLDEIFNIHDKIEVKNDIENFLISYENCTGIVTSRHIGYEEARLDNELFIEFNMLDFDEEQISKYVYNWYKCEVEINEEIENEIRIFLENTFEIDDELIKNPLLLSLIVILYRNNGRLPNSKLEIYRSCTNTLVDKWDETKKLEIDLNVIKKKQNIFASLAFWQYEMLSQNSQEVISYEVVSKEIKSIILNQLALTDDNIEAEQWAQEFLEYAQKRSLYFDNDFTHKTFMEYFTAFCIYQKTDKKYKPKERDKIITKYLNNPFWYIVLELLINLIDEDQADDEIIDGIISKHTNTKESYIFFLQIINTIKNVSIRTKRLLIKTAISIAIKVMANEDNNVKFSMEVIRKLRSLLVFPEYSEIIQNIYDDLYAEVKDDEVLLLNYYIFGAEIKKRNRFSINYDQKLENYRSHNPYLYYFTLSDDITIELIKYSEYFGKDQLLKPIKFYFNTKISLPPLIYKFFTSQLIEKDEEKIRDNILKISDTIMDKSELIKFFQIFIQSRRRIIEIREQNIKFIEEILAS